MEQNALNLKRQMAKTGYSAANASVNRKDVSGPKFIAWDASAYKVAFWQNTVHA
jgi:hypothetical protein